MSVYILSEDADLDLDDIWEYIARDNLDAADRWIGKPFDAFEAIGQAPGIGHKREDLTNRPYRSFRWGPISSSIAVLANPLKLSP